MFIWFEIAHGTGKLQLLCTENIAATKASNKIRQLQHLSLCSVRHRTDTEVGIFFIGAPIHARKTDQNGENAKQQCAVKLEQNK